MEFGTVTQYLLSRHCRVSAGLLYSLRFKLQHLGSAEHREILHFKVLSARLGAPAPGLQQSLAELSGERDSLHFVCMCVSLISCKLNHSLPLRNVLNGAAFTQYIVHPLIWIMQKFQSCCFVRVP